MIDIDAILNNIDSDKLIIPFGRIKHIDSTTITATGLEVAVADIVKIESEQHLYTVLGMVASIDGDNFTIVPFSFIEGFRIHDKVFLQKEGLSVKSGYGLLGRVVGALSEPIDGKGKIKDLEESSAINKVAMPALERGVISRHFSTGVKAIDSMLTCGKGQKVGIFAGSGVGKSTLMGMIVKGSMAQIKVYGLDTHLNPIKKQLSDLFLLPKVLKICMIYQEHIQNHNNLDTHGMFPVPGLFSSLKQVESSIVSNLFLIQKVHSQVC